MNVPIRRTFGIVVVGIALALVSFGAATSATIGVPAAAAASEDLPRVRKVLVFAVPGLGWADVRSATMPNLLRYRDEAAISLLSTRIGQSRASIGDSYVSLGAGTRAVSDEHDAAYAFESGESLRIGDRVDPPLDDRPSPRGTRILHRSIAELELVNSASSFGATPGALGSTLADAGVHRVVIANADRGEVASGDEPYRAAVAALMDTRGTLAEGAIGGYLNRDDPSAPFGRRTDEDAVAVAFDRAWSPDRQVVVLVEASDALRVERAEPLTDPVAFARVRAETHRRVDRLFARLLASVDRTRDAVIVLGMPVTSDVPAFGLTAVRAAGVEPALLQSAVTRRAGYVALSDIAPTILEFFAIESELSMEGRAMFARETEGSSASRQRGLEHATAEADFRARVLAPFFVVLAGVSLAALLGYGAWARSRRQVGAFVRLLAEVGLSSIVASYLVGLVEIARRDGSSFVLLTLLFAVVLWLIARAADARRPGAGIAMLLSSIVGLLVVDVVTGAHLQLNTMFGYSTEIGGRFVGLGNLGFALLAPAALMLVVILVARDRGLATSAIVFLGVIVVVDGAPYFGADVGGVLAMIPSFAAALATLLEVRLRWVHAVLVLVGTGGLVLFFGFLDLARPAHDRAHLARLAEQVRDDGPGWIVTTIVRRWQGSFGGPLTSLIALALVIVAAGVAMVFGRRLMQRAVENRGGSARVAPAWFPDDPAQRSLIVGLGLLAAIGLFVNDSSIAVPGVMLLVIIPATTVWRLSGVPGRTSDT